MLAEADADLVRRDRALRGLALVLDADAVATVLHDALGIDARDIAALYVRYKPATSCLVAYRLIANGQDIRAYVKTHAGHSVAKLKAASSALVGDPPLIVNAFPVDARLRALPLLADGCARQGFLKRFMKERADAWTADLAVLAYKPERRFVGQLLVNGAPQAVVRLYRLLDFVKARTALTAFGSADLRVPRVISASERHRALALEWIEGARLDDILQSSDGRQAVARAGAALASLHRHHRGDLARSGRHEDQHRLRTAAETVAVLWPSLASRAADVAERVIESTPLLHLAAPVHGDFYPCQVLVPPTGKVAIIDVDEAEFGDPASDLATFIAHLERDATTGQLPREQLGSLREALLGGYGLDPSVMTPEMLDARVAGALLRLTPHFFRERWPQWPDRMAAVIMRAEELLRPATCHYLARSVSKSVAAADPALPALAGALDVKVAWHAIATLSQVESLGASRVRSARIVRYKPGRGCVVDYRLERRNGAPPLQLLGKIGRSRPDWRTHSVQRNLWHHGFADTSEDEISVPEPLGVAPNLNMWLQRHVAGQTATMRLMTGHDRALAAHIAHAIRKLHTAPLSLDRTHTIEEELQIVNDRLARVSAFRPGWRRRLERVAKECARLAQRVNAVVAIPIHRDFYPDNVLVDGNRLYLIDFDLCCLGDPALDAGNFIGHLLELAVRDAASRMSMEEAAEIFEDEFARLAGRDTSRHVPTYVTLTLARHIYISTQFDDRRAHTEELLDLCERRLAGASAVRLAAGS